MLNTSNSLRTFPGRHKSAWADAHSLPRPVIDRVEFWRVRTRLWVRNCRSTESIHGPVGTEERLSWARRLRRLGTMADGSDATRMAMSLSRGRGHIRTDRGRALVVARCPLCGEEHRYDKGAAGGEEIESLRKVGYTDEWLPCQLDLPGNFWRIVITGGRQGASSESPRRGRRTKGK